MRESDRPAFDFASQYKTMNQYLQINLREKKKNHELYIEYLYSVCSSGTKTTKKNFEHSRTYCL